MKTYRKGILSTALWIALTVTCHAQTTWTITEVDLSPNDLSVDDPRVININNSGQVAGGN